tara:strand:+ start:439 stop:654 length:216 start_codon:yes stop_codon:yes gene_type:complete
MGNYTDAHDKIVVHLKELYRKHRALDNEVTDMQKSFAPDQQVNVLKTKKLWFKDEINRLENELKALGNGNL